MCDISCQNQMHEILLCYNENIQSTQNAELLDVHRNIDISIKRKISRRTDVAVDEKSSKYFGKINTLVSN